MSDFVFGFLTLAGASVGPEGEARGTGALWPTPRWAAVLLTGVVSCR